MDSEKEKDKNDGSLNSDINNFLYPNEPSRFHRKDVEKLFVWAFEQGASDIFIATAENIILDIHGKLHRVTKHRLDHTEALEILVAMYGSETAKAKLAGDDDLDFPFQVNPDRETSYRFRVNATAIIVNGAAGIDITARTIPGIPPLLSDMNLEPAILANLEPKQGMIVVAGATGSGKSTLLASVIRWLAEQPDGNRRILTYESPIEFVYDKVNKPSSTISQSEVGKNLKSFVAGSRNALRRSPEVVLLGEARDAETIGEAVTLSMTGHLLYTTVHASGFADTIRRMVNVFNFDKNARATDIVSSMRMIICQRLVPSVDGKRVALREYVVMNDEIVDVILDAGIDYLTASCRKVLLQYGRSFLQDATEKYEAGIISKKVWKEIARTARAEDLDALALSSEALRKAVAVKSEPEISLTAKIEDPIWPESEPKLDLGKKPPIDYDDN